jgi:ribonuclease-3
MDKTRIKKIKVLLENPIFNIKSVSKKSLILYDEALTHRSYAKEMHDKKIECQDNERLEFFGNFILGFIVSDFLYNEFEYSEGEMTKRMEVVSDAKLTESIRQKKIGLERGVILLGKGRSTSKNILEGSIIACAFEALIGAIFLDQGLEKTKEVVLNLLKDEIIHFDTSKNYIARVQEIVQKTKLGEIKYSEKKVTGPDHRPTFKSVIKIAGKKYGDGVGQSKKAARMGAAKVAIQKLKRKKRNAKKPKN